MKQVYFDHDAGVDDLLSIIFLMGMKNVAALGIGVTPADCYLETGLPATLKILQLLGHPNIPVAAGTVEGRHPFPHEWRVHSDLVNGLPILNARPFGQPQSISAHELLIQKARAAADKVTLLFTGPLTNLAAALDSAPDIESKIERLYWMGGAIDVPGNVLPPDGDGAAEWNVFWDSVSAARVWKSSLPITLVGLDATDKVPVSESFLARLAQQRQYLLSDLAYQCWQFTHGTGYHLWDTLTTLAVGWPDIVGARDVSCEVVIDGPSDGRTIRSANGRIAQVAFDVDPERVYQTALDLLKQ
ncbi:MAG: ABC transporter substrate-binding protein [Chloroflexi bacterium]|nr:ABC transporter substrate-binding protein [Chloroflexota bacterium]